jgi:two-component system, sensor histidine kinase and response regulator
LIGRTTLEVGLYAAEARSRLLEAVRRDGTVRNADVTLFHKSGAARHCLFSAEVLDLPDGQLLLVSLVDITERQQLAAALRNGEERLRYALDATSEGLWDRDLVTDIESVNDRWYFQLGYQPGEVQPTASTWQSVLHPDDAPATALALDDYLHGRRPEYRCEHRVITKSGEVRWFLSVGKIVAWDAAGKPLRIVGTNADITERKQAEQLLRDNEERFRLVVENSPNPILIWSDTGAVLYASPAVAATLGHSSDMVAGRISQIHRLATEHGAAAVTPEDLAEQGAAKLAGTHRWFRALEGIQYCIQHPGERVQTEERLPLPTGEMRDLMVISQGFAHSMSGSEVVSVIHDITEHRALQRLLEQQVAARTVELEATVAELHRANTAKDAFLAAVSHELRTPLTGILSMSELLQTEMFGALNPNQHKYLGAILESTHRLVSAVNSILLYTNLVAGRMPLESEPCRLHELCAIAIRSLMRKADNKHQHITQEINPFELEIESSPKGVLQVLKELLENAIKFTPEGGSIELRVTALPDEAAVSIVVADNGIGMSEDQLASIFRPFAQGDQSLARRFEGLGLGLAYVREMVTRLGGTIAVTSTPGDGSRFTITLPAAPSHQPAPAPAEKNASSYA